MTDYEATRARPGPGQMPCPAGCGATISDAWFRGVPRELQPPDWDWPGPPHRCRAHPLEAVAERLDLTVRLVGDLAAALELSVSARRERERERTAPYPPGPYGRPPIAPGRAGAAPKSRPAPGGSVDI